MAAVRSAAAMADGSLRRAPAPRPRCPDAASARPGGRGSLPGTPWTHSCSSVAAPAATRKQDSRRYRYILFIRDCVDDASRLENGIDNVFLKV